MGLKDGWSTLRVEDYRFQTGADRYTDDIAPNGSARAVFIRSPHAHATIAILIWARLSRLRVCSGYSLRQISQRTASVTCPVPARWWAKTAWTRDLPWERGT